MTAPPTLLTLTAGVCSICQECIQCGLRCIQLPCKSPPTPTSLSAPMPMGGSPPIHPNPPLHRLNFFFGCAQKKSFNG